MKPAISFCTGLALALTWIFILRLPLSTVWSSQTIFCYDIIISLMSGALLGYGGGFIDGKRN